MALKSITKLASEARDVILKDLTDYEDGESFNHAISIDAYKLSKYTYWLRIYYDTRTDDRQVTLHATELKKMFEAKHPKKRITVEFDSLAVMSFKTEIDVNIRVGEW